MFETKSVLQSLGIMGPLLALVAMLLNNFLFKDTVITDADVTNAVNLVTSVVGLVTGIIGRWRATKQVGLRR